jgi:hypothetical protein
MKNELPPTSAVILACDPGLSGAVCCLKNGSIELRRDFKVLPDIARGVAQLSQGVTHCVMELVHAFPGQGVCSVWSFARAAGVADGAFALCLPSLILEEVSPQKWQRFFRERFNIEKGTEFDSRAIACQIFPAQAEFFKRKKDHNSADAALLCVWKAHQVFVRNNNTDF